MNTALILGAFIGCVMLVVGLALIIPELAIDSPVQLLTSFITKSWDRNFFSLVHTHLREGWPDTRVAAFLYYGGLSCLGFALLGYWLQPCFAQLVFMLHGAGANAAGVISVRRECLGFTVVGHFVF